nr:hypothetical protein [Chloroflexia bacterium]
DLGGAPPPTRARSGGGKWRASAGEGAPPLRFVRGPQADRFTREAVSAFSEGVYTVTSRSDRVGLRLSGPVVRAEGGADVISEGQTTGGIQIAGDGQPIVMLPARATVGGYARIGTVIGADLDRLGQLPPGATVRFREVSVPEARALTVAARRVLTQGQERADPVMAAGEEHEDMAHDEERSMTEERDIIDEEAVRPDEAIAARLAEFRPGGTWDPKGVRRIIRALAETGVTDFELRVKSAGLHIRIARGDGASRSDRLDRAASTARLPGEAGSGMGGAEPPTTDERGIDPSPATGDEATTVTAPMLGVFYQRPSPDDPPFASPGEGIADGQTIGLIEVMKSFHEVPAPHGGIFDAYLTADQQSVEFGTPIARILRDDAQQRD